ncbi:WD repeat-containing protein, partial [Reticulomyxa filosa]
ATTFFMFDIFRSSSKLINTFTGHTDSVCSIDYSTFDDCQFICSGSDDNTVCVWDVDNNKQIQSLNGHSGSMNCVKFSSYHYHNHRQNVICSASSDRTISFWDFKHNKQLQIFNEHTDGVVELNFHHLMVVDICVLVLAIQFVYGMLKHQNHYVFSVDMKEINNNNDNNDKMNNIGVIGGNGYTICSGLDDNTIRIWDIETTKQFNVFEGHKDYVNSVKYGSNELLNTILSGSSDNSVCLWDIRSGQQIQMFYGHYDCVYAVEYSPFVIKNGIGNSNVICSGSWDNTIRFWDIRSNKKELYMIEGSDDEDDRILCLKFISLKKKVNNNEQKSKDDCNVHLYYGSYDGSIHILSKFILISIFKIIILNLELFDLFFS